MANARLENLRRAIFNAAMRPRQMQEPQRRWTAIVLSILVAFLLWLTFSLRETYTVVVEMPIEIGRLPEGRALSEMPPRFARVTIQGVGEQLMWLQRNPPPLVINATGEQVDVFAAASESPRLPSGLSVQNVSPSSMLLALEPEVMRNVPIQLVLDVDTAPDHDFIGSPQITPDSVTVVGARSLVHPLVAFPTEPLVIDGARQTVNARVALSDTLRGLVRTNVAYVDATVPIAAFTESTRELEVHIEGAPADGPQVMIIPSRVQATFRVPIDHYDRARRTPDFYAFVPYESVLADTTGSLMPVVQLPSSVTVRDVRLDPRRVRYWVRIE